MTNVKRKINKFAVVFQKIELSCEKRNWPHPRLKIDEKN